MPLLLLYRIYYRSYYISLRITANSEEQNSNFFRTLCEVFFFTPTFAEKLLNRSDGGGKRDRTADLLHAMQALSQLSYTPLQNRSEIVEPDFGFVNTL